MFLNASEKKAVIQMNNFGLDKILFESNSPLEIIGVDDNLASEANFLNVFLTVFSIKLFFAGV